MKTIQVTRIINRPVHEVFQFAANPKNDHQWQPSLVRHEGISDDPVGIGSTWTEVRSLGGRERQFHITVNNCIPDQLVEFTGNGGAFSVEGRLIFDSHDGKTKFTQEMRFRGTGITRLVESFVAKQSRREIESNLDSLKNFLD